MIGKDWYTCKKKKEPQKMTLTTHIGPLVLPNPILVASGTFGYAKEMAGTLDISRLGGIVPKTVTLSPRAGNKPPRTVETAAGLLNSIGLDNDGIDEFLEKKMPWLRTLGPPIILSIAAKSIDECAILGEKMASCEGIAAVELNVSCPNVSGGVDFGSDTKLCESMTACMRQAMPFPLIVKLSPNVTKIAEIAQAAQQGGADAIAAINTCLGLSVDWRTRRPRLGNGFGGLSGPAIKPIALRCVQQIYRAVQIPIIGIGGIESVEDVMEFLVAGATAIQVGTANFYDPTVTIRIIEALPNALREAGAQNCGELVGTLQMPV